MTQGPRDLPDVRDRRLALDPNGSAIKSALDYAELIERVPELVRASGRNLPRHPAVIAYVRECASLIREERDNLRTARHRLKIASAHYNVRCAFRLQSSQFPIEWRDGGKCISLSSIVEARAEAKYWNKVVLRLEAEKKLHEQREQNRRHIVRHRLRNMGLMP